MVDKLLKSKRLRLPAISRSSTLPSRSSKKNASILDVGAREAELQAYESLVAVETALRVAVADVAQRVRQEMKAAKATQRGRAFKAVAKGIASGFLLGSAQDVMRAGKENGWTA